MQCATLRDGPYYDYIMQRYDVITNRTMERCNYITLRNVTFFQRTVAK